MDCTGQNRDFDRAVRLPIHVRHTFLQFARTAIAIGIGMFAVPVGHAQQYGPNFYFPPMQAPPSYNSAPPPAYYPQPAPAGPTMPRPFGYYPTNQGAPMPQQFPRIYGPLTASPQSAPQLYESAAPAPAPALMPSTPVYEDAPPVQTAPNADAPAYWPAPKRPAQLPTYADAPAAASPGVDIPFHRPTNSNTGWVTMDYLVSVAKSMQPSQPLATTSLPGIARSGSLGQAETAALYGQQAIDFGLISGIRLNLGCFLDSDNRFSTEIDFLWRGTSSASFNAASDSNGYPIIARPIFNTADGANRDAAFLTSFPALFKGSTEIHTRSGMGGIELNGRYHVYWWERVHADVLLGFRYLNLSESMHFNDQLTPLVKNQLTFKGSLIGTQDAITDQDIFGTSNQLFAGQIGGRVSWETGRFDFDAYAKLALGATAQHVNIDGSTTLITPTGTQVATGGILAQNSNIGSYNRTTFAVVPEFGLNLGIQLLDHVRLRLGYSLLLWNSVARPTGQIDNNVNTGQVPSSPNFGRTTGPSTPTFQFNDEFFWNHFFNLGVEFRY